MLAQGNSLQARADTAYTIEWDVQEQATLDAALARYPADRHPPLERYVRAAAGLPKKCGAQAACSSLTTEHTAIRTCLLETPLFWLALITLRQLRSGCEAKQSLHAIHSAQDV